ncbi:MAG: GNAT family N-acetyltransferase [Alistipes sp.]|nr:GNAT family N-acetyltransferase [Alistipes sp.]
MIEPVTHYDEQLIASIRSLLGQLTQQTIIFGEQELRGLLANDASHLFIMREQEEVVGMLTLATYLSPTGRKAWVEDVVVDSAYRSRGYGRALISHAIRYCEETLSPCTLMLTSNPQREAANALYRTSGFEQKITNVYKLNCPDNE